VTRPLTVLVEAEVFHAAHVVLNLTVIQVVEHGIDGKVTSSQICFKGVAKGDLVGPTLVAVAGLGAVGGNLYNR
jgi:hypothetical protein